MIEESMQLNELSIRVAEIQTEDQEALQSIKLNTIMTVFSVVSLLFMPPVVTGGLFGMNVRVPG
jgi:Mg2+ and Co2+ transporter CorA